MELKSAGMKKLKLCSFSQKVFLGALLLIAFILVFGTVLTDSFFEYSGDSMTQNEVALAADTVGGGSNPINLSPTIEEFRGETSTAYTDTYTHLFNNNGVATLKLDSPATLSWVYEAGSSTGTTTVAGNKFDFVSESHSGDTFFYGTVNIKLTSSYLRQLLDNNFATSVNAKLTYKLKFGNDDKYAAYGSTIRVSRGTVSATSKTSNFTTQEYDNASANVYDMVHTVPITSANFSGTDYVYINLFFYCKQAWLVGNRTMTFSASDMQVDMSATFPLETGRPKVTAATIQNSITNIANQPVTFTPEDYAEFETIETELSSNLDSTAPGTGNESPHTQRINMLSFRRTSLGSIGGKSYYKRLSLTFNDYVGTTKDTTGLSTCAGIRRIELGDSTGGMYFVYSASSLTGYIVNDGIQIGYFSFSRSNKSQVTATLSFYCNANFQINVVDYIGNSNMTEVVISGIDITAPDTPKASLNSSILQAPAETNPLPYDETFAAAQWWNESTMAVEIEALSADFGEALVVYFYNIAYSRTGEYGTFTDLYGNTGSFPSAPADYGRVFAAGNVNTLMLDFAALSGSGYYILGLQAIDLSGNKTLYNDFMTRYFIKVDCDSATYTVDLTTGDQAKPYESGSWTTDKITATITITSRSNSAGGYHSETNLSGNMLSYIGADAKDHYLIVKGINVGTVETPNFVAVITASDSFGTLTNANTQNAVYTDGTLTITYSHGVFTIVTGDKGFMQSGNMKYYEIDFETLFTVYVGVSMETDFYYPTAIDIMNNDPTIAFRSDRNKPMEPILIDEVYSLLNQTDYSSTNIPQSERMWFTNAWNMSVSTLFSDDLLSTNGENIKLYIGVSVNKFPVFTAESILNGFISGGYLNYLNYVTSLNLFDGISCVSASTVEGGGNVLVNFLQGQGSGLRNVYIWAVDQAMNTSSAERYQVLVDANVYNIAPLIDPMTQSHFGPNAGSLEYFNSEGAVVTGFKRGERLFINVNVSEGFIPYKIRLSLDGGAPSDIYTNNTLTSIYSEGDWGFSVEGFNLEMLIDSEDIVSQPEIRNRQYLFSFRKIVELSLGNTIVYYSGYTNEIDYVVSVEDIPNFIGFPCDNIVDFTSIYYSSYTDENNFVLTGAANGSVADGGAPKNAGQYFVRAKVDGNHYVSEELFSTYRINKLTINLVAVEAGSAFGLPINLAANPEVVGDDLLNIPSPISGSLKLQNVASLTKLPVGKYNIVVDTPFVYENYNIVFVSAIYEVFQYGVLMTVTPSQGKEYGEADPVITYTIDDGQTFPDEIQDIILGGAITRSSGENVTPEGYAYTNELVVNPNYLLVLASSDNFMISKRQINILPVQGQRAILGSTYDIKYNVDNDDKSYVSYILGALSLGAAPVLGSNAILLDGLYIDALMSSNLDLVMNDTEFLELIEGAQVVITAGILLNEVTYLDACPTDATSDMFDFSGERFIVTGLETYAYYSISWSWTINGYTAGANIGLYLVSVSGITVLAGADEASATDITSTTTVDVSDMFLKVNPAVITVNLIETQFSKVYGAEEPVIGFTVSSAVGNATDWQIVNGAFSRAVYFNGDFYRLGSLFDNPSSLLAAGETYGVGVKTSFQCNSNFVIEYSNLDEAVFTIEKYVIDLSNCDFYGKNKSYDGTTVVNFGGGDLKVEFFKPNNNDEVSLNFTSSYDLANAGARTITFSAFSLSGANANKYDVRFEGQAIDGSTSITISKLTPQSATDDIAILKADIDLIKADIIVTKEYDGTTNLSGKAISFARGALKNLSNNLIAATGTLAQKNVGINLQTNVVITITLANASSNYNLVLSGEQGLSITLSENSVTITASIPNASIVPKKLTLDSFNFTGVNKRYNKTATASVNYDYKTNALGEGDSKVNVPVTIAAHFATLNGEIYENAINAGQWTVLIDSISQTNPNYTLDITAQDLEDLTSINASILPTRLLLNINYDTGRQYDGTFDVVYTTAHDFKVFGGDPFDSADLANMSFSLTSIVMSLNGLTNTQVMFNEAGTAVKLHNVLISGINISADASVTLSNYELIGYVYSTESSQYIQTSFAIQGEIPSLEMLEVATLKRRELDIQTTAIHINDKFYDATSVGTGSIDKDEIGILPAELDFIGVTFTVEFTGVDVHPAVKAFIRVVAIVNEAAAGGIDYARNYKMKDGSSVYAYGYAQIKCAPLTFNVALANKVYDGTRDAKISSYVLHGIKDIRDEGKYTLSSLFGAFSSINAGDVVTGSAYGLTLSYNGYTNGTGSYKNYTLTYDYTASEWQTLFGEELPSSRANFYMTDTSGAEAVHYFTIESKQFSKIVSTLYNPETHGFVYTTVIEGGNIVYYVDYIGSGEIISLNGFEAAAGTISRKVVTVSAALTAEGLLKLDKIYDGTTIFNGVEGVDYTVTISGICMNEDVTIAAGGISVAYDNANASAILKDRVLVFSITGLQGENSANYSFTGATARVSATISRAQLYVKLADVNVFYGDSQRTFNLTFFRDAECTDQLFYQNGKLGYTGDHDGNPETPDQFIVLDSKFTLPQVIDGTNNFTSANVYPLNLAGGSSNNYNFNFLTSSRNGTQIHQGTYSFDNVAAIISIQKVILYTYATDKYTDTPNVYNYMKIYRGGNPQIVLGYSSSAVQIINGFRNGQTASGLSAAGLFSEPIARFRLFNTANGTWSASEIALDAPVTVNLTNAMYAVHLDTQNATARNYEIRIKYNEQYALEEAERFSGNDFTLLGNYLDKLFVTYAAIEGISAKNVTAIYDGTTKTISLTGVNVGTDSVSFEYFNAVEETYDNNGTPATRLVRGAQSLNAGDILNAGFYCVAVRVSRANHVDWTGEAFVTVSPRAVALTLRRLVVNYDGNNHRITENRDVIIENNLVNKNDINYVYSRNGAALNAGALPRNAGSYLVYAEFNPANATATSNPTNYAYSRSESVALIINPILVNITVAARQAIFDENGFNQLEFTAEVDSAFSNYDVPEISVRYRDSYSDRTTDYISYPGNFSFEVMTTNVNYQLQGHTRGVFILGISYVEETSAAPKAKAEAKEGSLIYADTKLIYTEKAKGKNASLWTQVDSNVTILGSFFKPLLTSGIVDVSMVIDTGQVQSRVQPSGEVMLTMDLPKGTANGDKLYVVTAEGTLKELSYTYSSGKVTVMTDYVGYFVFVKDGSFPWWFIAVIGSAVLLAVGIAVAVILAKKKKIKDAQLVVVGTNPDGSPIEITVKEKRERDKKAEIERIAEEKRIQEANRQQELKRLEEERRKAAELAARPEIRQVMKAEKADSIKTGTAVNAQQAAAADTEVKKPGVLEALSVDTKPATPPRPPRPAPPAGARPSRPTPPPRPQGKPPVGLSPDSPKSDAPKDGEKK